MKKHKIEFPEIINFTDKNISYRGPVPSSIYSSMLRKFEFLFLLFILRKKNNKIIIWNIDSDGDLLVAYKDGKFGNI